MDGMVGKILSVFRILPFWPTLQQINLKKNNTKKYGYIRAWVWRQFVPAGIVLTKRPRAAGHPDQMSSWQYVFLTERLLTHKLIFQMFVNHQKAPKPLKSTKNYQKHPRTPKIYGKVTICCQKLPFVAKSYHLLPKVTIYCQKFPFVAKSWHLLPKVTICC